MIRELRIRNLAIIEDLRLEFDPALNVMTGETGAGKSIILDALRLILGERSSAEDVRTGEDAAEAEALIDGPFSRQMLALLEESGAPADDDGMVLRREISSSGKSKAVVNGRLAPASQLKQLGDLLVDVHGQHQHQSLLNSTNHLTALDAYANVQNEIKRVGELYAAWTTVKSSLQKLQGDERALAREKDTLEFQLREIDQAELRCNEEQELSVERNRLRNAEKLRECAARAYLILRDGEEDVPAALDLIGTAEASVIDLVKLDDAQTDLNELLVESRFRLQEVAERLRVYADALESDPHRLQQVDDRLDLIHNLKRKYGNSIEEILKVAETNRARLNSLTNRNDEMAKLEQELAARESELMQEATALSAKRKRSAAIFEKLVEKELSQLQMPRTKFLVEFQQSPIGPNGIDRVEFLLAANPGEAPKVLRKVASGGELSRVMLALKSILAEKDAIPTLVFDEIDAGISGATAQVVGDKLRALARTHQVICITHLPQIAVRATRHFAVEKVQVGQRMKTHVRALAPDERIDETARLLGGDASSRTARQHAQELLSKYQEGMED